MASVYLLGSEGTGWSIDYDYNHTEMFLLSLGHKISNPIAADLVHAVWWNKIIRRRTLPLHYKPVMAVVTNEVDTDSKDFKRGQDIIDLWIVPSDRAYEKLDPYVDVKYQPFYVDERVFQPLNLDQEELCADLGINYKRLENRFVIGSFQRDSLGENLQAPKWQKNPELLVDILSELPNDEVLLFLAGPRRHWIINECERRGIPYLFYGSDPEPGVDDLSYNVWGKWTMNKLYNLIDCYIVPSTSEGGPKAILESAWTKTHVLSTDVGLASDIIDDWCIYENSDEAVEKVIDLMTNDTDDILLEYQHKKVVERASYTAMLKRWNNIYEYFETAHL